MENRQERKPKEATDCNFSGLILDSDKPVLVDFWAPWCNPCLAMASVLDNLAASYAGRITVARCNVDKNPLLSTRCGVQSIPTLILFDKGRAVKKIVGLVPTDRIKESVDRALAALPQTHTNQRINLIPGTRSEEQCQKIFPEELF